jgi:hypothetical protein
VVILCGKISPAMIEPEELPELDLPQTSNISHGDVQTVRAEFVEMNQSASRDVTANEVTMQQSAAGRMSADEASLHQSAAGFIKANHVNLSQASAGMVRAGEFLSHGGSTGFAQAEKASVSGYTGAVVAGSAEIQHGMAVFVAGRDVHLEESRTGILIARNLSGNVTTLVDTRGALLMGLVGGLFAGLMLLLGRALFGRK